MAEPEGKGSAAAIGLAALHLRRRDPAAVMACLPADHFISEAEAFRQVLGVASRVAQTGHLVTLGIVPDRPETGYGYIQRGAPLEGPFGGQVLHVKRFVEKPPVATARRWARSERYLWNSGMFVWKAERILEEIMRWMPALTDQLMRVAHALGTPMEKDVLDAAWGALSTETIDYGVMEKAHRVAVVPTRLGWSDVGHWQSVFELGPVDASGCVVTGQHVGLDTRGSFIYSPHRLVATIGIQDMVIVDSGDALLVCPRERAQEVRALVEALSKLKREDVL
jgi:mannose-1-phosphate guanylyltransferase